MYGTFLFLELLEITAKCLFLHKGDYDVQPYNYKIRSITFFYINVTFLRQEIYDITGYDISLALFK